MGDVDYIPKNIVKDKTKSEDLLMKYASNANLEFESVGRSESNGRPKIHRKAPNTISWRSKLFEAPRPPTEKTSPAKNSQNTVHTNGIHPVDTPPTASNKSLEDSLQEFENRKMKRTRSNGPDPLRIETEGLLLKVSQSVRIPESPNNNESTVSPICSGTLRRVRAPDEKCGIVLGQVLQSSEAEAKKESNEEPSNASRNAMSLQNSHTSAPIAPPPAPKLDLLQFQNALRGVKLKAVDVVTGIQDSFSPYHRF